MEQAVTLKRTIVLAMDGGASIDPIVLDQAPTDDELEAAANRVSQQWYGENGRVSAEFDINRMTIQFTWV